MYYVSCLFCSLWEPENREVGQKLGIATGFMFTLPVLTFFIAEYVFSDKKEPDNWAAGAAIIMTNIIVGTYCYMAYKEDSDQQKDNNDADQPRVGIYKQRVD